MSARHLLQLGNSRGNYNTFNSKDGSVESNRSSTRRNHSDIDTGPGRIDPKELLKAKNKYSVRISRSNTPDSQRKPDVVQQEKRMRVKAIMKDLTFDYDKRKKLSSKEEIQLRVESLEDKMKDIESLNTSFILNDGNSKCMSFKSFSTNNQTNNQTRLNGLSEKLMESDLMGNNQVKLLFFKIFLSFSVVIMNGVVLSVGELPHWIKAFDISHLSIHSFYILNILYIIIRSRPNQSLTVSKREPKLKSILKHAFPSSLIEYIATASIGFLLFYSIFCMQSVNSLHPFDPDTAPYDVLLTQHAVDNSKLIVVFNLIMNIAVILAFLAAVVLCIGILVAMVITAFALLAVAAVVFALYVIVYFGGFFWLCFGTKGLPSMSWFKSAPEKPNEEEPPKESKREEVVVEVADQELQKLLEKVKKQYREIRTSQKDCYLCQMDFRLKDSVYRLPCNRSHIFHESCLTKWLGTIEVCPKCKYDIRKSLAVPEQVAMQKPPKAKLPLKAHSHAKNKQEIAPIYSDAQKYCLDLNTVNDSDKDSKKSNSNPSGEDKSPLSFDGGQKEPWVLNLSAIAEVNSTEEDSLRLSKLEADEESKAKSAKKE